MCDFVPLSFYHLRPTKIHVKKQKKIKTVQWEKTILVPR